MVGSPRPPQPDQVACPTHMIWEVALTDRPFPATLQYLSTTQENRMPEDTAWLAVATPEGTQPGKVVWQRLPYKAQFRGHLGDPAYAHCPHADRIFVVDDVVATYAEKPDESTRYPMKLPEGYTTWPRYYDSSLGYSIPHPPDWLVAPSAEADLATAVALRAHEWPDYPVWVRVHTGETRYDQYDPGSIPALLDGDSFGIFEQGWAFDGQGEGQHLAGFQVERLASSTEQAVSVLFSANGYTYELALRFPLGFDAPQPLLTAYTVIVEGFRLDTPPVPHPLRR